MEDLWKRLDAGWTKAATLPSGFVGGGGGKVPFGEK